MKITVLVGNGFDISLGVKSSYGDFYKWYCDLPSDVEHIASFRKNIKEEMLSDIPNEERTWADFEVGLGKYTANFTKETAEDFLDCYEDAQENVREYLLEQENSFDPLGFSAGTFEKFPISVCEFFEEVTDLDKLAINSMLNNYRDQDREITFVTFNYTRTLEKILQEMAKMKELANLPSWRYQSTTYCYRLNQNIIHVHGTLDNFPVLGVNDETQIAKKELLEMPEFKELLIKSENVRALGQLWHNKAEEQISSSKFVCILGASLGETDAKWWRKLVQWLKADVNRRIILYWFVKQSPGNISARKQLRSVNSAKEKLLSYSNITEEEKSTLKNRIHVVINTKKFMHLEAPIDFPVKEEEVATT